uniref:Uncharacterized protein n=1 Tax=Ciona savignyi TaxID=51511 RepID=H2YIR3_CIOSA
MDTVRYNAYDGYELNNLTPESNGQLRRKVHFNRSGSATASPRSRAPPSDNNHPKTSTPIRGVKSQPTITTRSRAWTDDEILQVQTLLPGEPQPAIDFPGTPRSISRISSDYTTFTGLPSSENFGENTQDTILAYQSNGVRPRAVTPQLSTTSSTTSGSRQHSEMGGVDSKSSSRSIHPRNMMSVDPQEILDRRKLVSETDITGNCRPWSDHVYYKLFLDPDGRNATLMVLKCEITYVDVFTDEEHSLYKCRFIGGKADGVAQLFVFDLMKAKWEEKIPRSQAIELNVDIVMSSSPIHQCSETLLKLVQLE